MLEEKTQKIGSGVEAIVEPVRRSVFERFPVLFLMLVTFGVTATFLGLEQFLLRIAFFMDHPLRLLSLGVLTLLLTGTLYKKLG